MHKPCNQQNNKITRIKAFYGCARKKKCLKLWATAFACYENFLLLWIL